MVQKYKIEHLKTHKVQIQRKVAYLKTHKNQVQKRVKGTEEALY